MHLIAYVIFRNRSQNAELNDGTFPPEADRPLSSEGGT